MEERKMSNPTPPPLAVNHQNPNPKILPKTTNNLNALQNDWESFNNNSRPRHMPKTSISDTTHRRPHHLFRSLLAPRHSPRALMPRRLHRRNPPPDRSWAVQEVLRDRRAAIMSGRLKGRRLFIDGREEIEKIVMDDLSGRVEFGQLSGGFLEEKVVVVEEKRAAVAARKGRYVAAMAWFAFVLILVTVGVIIMSDFVGENELSLIPT